MLDWDDNLLQLLHYNENDFSKMSDNFFELIHPEDIKATKMATYLHLFENTPLDIEHRIKTGLEPTGGLEARGRP